MSGVAANWVNSSFTSLRVTVPEGGMYRISYWAVNKSNTTEQEVVTTGSSSQVIKGFSPDYFYTIVVEDQDVFMKTGKGSAGIGEYYPNMLHDIYLDLIILYPLFLPCRHRDYTCCCRRCHISTIRTVLLLAC